MRNVPPVIPSRIISQFCMKKVGRSTVYGSSIPRECSSTSHLLSKCGMPVSLCALPTEL